MQKNFTSMYKMIRVAPLSRSDMECHVNITWLFLPREQNDIVEKTFYLILKLTKLSIIYFKFDNWKVVSFLRELFMKRSLFRFNLLRLECFAHEEKSIIIWILLTLYFMIVQVLWIKIIIAWIWSVLQYGHKLFWYADAYDYFRLYTKAGYLHIAKSTHGNIFKCNIFRRMKIYLDAKL